MIVKIDQAVPAYDSYAAERTRGLYNVGVSDGTHFRLQADLPIEGDDWQVGVVVGPSGSGKSSILRELMELEGWSSGEEALRLFDERPIIEVLSHKSYAKATASLASVGLGSVPSWLRPYRVLSTGEQFRAHMAAILNPTDWDAENIVVDEFTSVLDRQVAKVGASAFAKAWRKQPGRRVILFTCHYDVLEWIEPDWFLDTAEGLDKFAEHRGVVQAHSGDFQRHSRGQFIGNEIARIEC